MIVSFVALYTVVFFSFAALLFAGEQEFTISFTSTISVAGVVWVAIVALASILAIDKTPISLIIAVIPALTLLFVGRLSYAAMIGAGLLFILTYTAQRSIYAELGRYIRIRISTICSFGVRMLLFGMLLSFVVFSIPLVASSIASGKIIIPVQTVESIAGVVVDQPQQVATAVTEYIRSRAQNNSAVIIIIIIAVALLAVRTAVPIVMWPTLAIVAILFWIARKTSLVKITEHNAPVEYIQL